MNSGYGGSEDDRGRDREIISVIGSPTGSESVTGSQSIALPSAKPRSIDWFSVGKWSGISETDVLKKCEEIMVACFRVGGGMPEFKFPEPVFKKIGPFPRKLVVVLQIFVYCLFACYIFTLWIGFTVLCIAQNGESNTRATLSVLEVLLMSNVV